MDMKTAKNLCNKIVNNAKKEYWQSFCTKEVSSFKDSKKIWKKITDMKNSTRLPSYPIKIDGTHFPSNLDKAETFVEFFSKNSRKEGLSVMDKTYREEQEKSMRNANSIFSNDLYINAPITITELRNAISAINNKTCSVGIDVISNEMINHLPENAIIFLHKLFKKCWEEGSIPQLWKDSIIVPILKAGKQNNDKNNYRPIALTSHTCKLLESIILKRLLHYCDENNIIPKNQAGFRKERSATEHLVKLSTQIKHQFARRKSVLATFFDVRKAYDQVWHCRLLQKLKNIGLSGNISQYIENFLNNRTMSARVGKTYSTARKLEMGIPQGSIIAPLLFNILIYDMPKIVSNNTTLVQYADDICMWMNVTLKKSTPLRSQNHTKKIYQASLNSLAQYMATNGLSLSQEKTNMILFNSGDSPANLPIFHLDGKPLDYKQNVKFLGVIFTQKLTWNMYFDHMLTKARKSLNMLKIISKLPWGMDVESLIHLSTALIRSKLTYGQEVYFSAPKYLLKKILSLDCKAYKLALGVPTHTSNKEVYETTGILPLDNYRELATCKFVVRASSKLNYIEKELKLRSDLDFPKRAVKISSQTTIATYTQNLIGTAGIRLEEMSKRPPNIPIPPWEIPKPYFDTNYTDMKKDENTNILTSVFKTHSYNKYRDHLQIFTDGSVLDNKNVGAAFVIPALRIEKFFFLGNNLSIFTAELTAVMTALECLLEFSNTISKAVIFVDSKSVLSTLDSFNTKGRPDLVFEIYNLLYHLSMKNTVIEFCWVPSHCNIHGNEMADRAAKKGATKSNNFISLPILPSVDESYRRLEKTSSGKNPYNNIVDIKPFTQILEIMKKNLYGLPLYQSRQLTSLTFRLKLNSFKTRFSKNVICSCGERITQEHILFSCPVMKLFLPGSFTSVYISEEFLPNLLQDFSVLMDIAETLIHSPLGRLL